MNGMIQGNIYTDFRTGLQYRIISILKVEKHTITYELRDNKKLEYNGLKDKFLIQSA